jgi:CubicO group peptidase (beta-lactamase class C family)
MRSRALLRLLPFLCAAFLPVASHGQSQGPGASLDAVLRPYLARYDLPAVAVAIVKKGEVVASGAMGTRRIGADIPVSVHDRPRRLLHASQSTYMSRARGAILSSRAADVPANCSAWRA